jgi:hypothetical protein
MALRPGMTNWYDPPRIIGTAIRVAISTIFGEFADRRDAMAAARPINPAAIDPACDYRNRAQGDLWLDFVADAGDGWNPTYAVARLLAEPALPVDRMPDPLPMGDILILGGDQVYPTASREDYRRKLVEPYEAAAQGKPWASVAPPDVYAVPGNHDWYDGLLAFLGQFCRRQLQGIWATARPGRMVGGRLTQQTRSYFALALPHDWWIWGVDSQLKGYFDQPQLEFFTHVARAWMAPGSRLILCTGQPSWAYVDPRDPEPAFKNFAYVESLADLAGRGHRLRLVLTGDSHHYARYEEGDRQYITAGGGGAFLHPTHHLEDKPFERSYPPPGATSVIGQPTYQRDFRIATDPVSQEPSLFPDRSTSRKLSLRNIFFAFYNWQYATVLGLACAFFAWLLAVNARVLDTTLSQFLAPQLQPTLVDTLGAYLQLSVVSPWPMLLVLAALGGYYYLADFGDGVPRLTAGLLHGLAQVGSVMLVSCLIARWLAPSSDVWLIVWIGIAGGVLSATILGLNFLICLSVFGRHWNEAFSALRIEDYKCFLRLRFCADGSLNIYPIGLMSVPQDDKTDPPQNPPLHPHLIEGPISLS